MRLGYITPKWFAKTDKQTSDVNRNDLVETVFRKISVPVLLDDHSDCEPPDPIPNSEVKPVRADGSVGSPHVRVGHRQAPYLKP